MKRNVFILFHKGRESVLSQDARLRCAAGDYYARQCDTERVFFVGGGGLPVAGAARMKRFWVAQGFARVRLGVCAQSCTSHSNICEIRDVDARYPDTRSVIITSHYHCARVRMLLLASGMRDIDVLGVEDILRRERQWRTVIERYEKSFALRFAYVREYFLRKSLFLESFLLQCVACSMHV